MTEVDGAPVVCGCCGADRSADDVSRLPHRPEIAVCGDCVQTLAASLGNQISTTTILPVRDMAAARDFWTRAGLEVEDYSPDYAFVLLDGTEIAHLNLVEDLDPAGNPTACYFRVADPAAWHQRLSEQGLPATELQVQPLGMVEFSVTDPSGNLVRFGSRTYAGSLHD